MFGSVAKVDALASIKHLHVLPMLKKEVRIIYRVL